MVTSADVFAANVAHELTRIDILLITLFAKHLCEFSEHSQLRKVYPEQDKQVMKPTRQSAHFSVVVLVLSALAFEPASSIADVE